MHRLKSTRIILVLFILAGVIYNSWPLGYWLNPVTANSSLASDLEFTGQPYAWVFILSDILTAVLIAMGVILAHALGRRALRAKRWKVVLAGITAFGLLTATASAVPQGCVHAPILTLCIPYGNTQIGADGIESTLAAIGLLVSMMAVALIKHDRSGIRALARVTVGLWAASGILFLIATSDNAALFEHHSQQVFLITSGIGTAAIGWALATVIHKTRLAG